LIPRSAVVRIWRALCFSVCELALTPDNAKLYSLQLAFAEVP
jgi:hypothetical protein